MAWDLYIETCREPQPSYQYGESPAQESSSLRRDDATWNAVEVSFRRCLLIPRPSLSGDNECRRGYVALATVVCRPRCTHVSTRPHGGRRLSNSSDDVMFVFRLRSYQYVRSVGHTAVLPFHVLPRASTCFLSTCFHVLPHASFPRASTCFHVLPLSFTLPRPRQAPRGSFRMSHTSVHQNIEFRAQGGLRVHGVGV
jgi:hypothetical protein